MADRIYPRMSYHQDWPKISGQVVADEAADKRMGDGWDDPYGVRSAPSAEEVPVKRKGGRPRKVTE